MPLALPDLYREVLAELGALDAGNVPSPEDAARVAQRYPAVLAQLWADRVIAYFDYNATPDDITQPLIRYVAEQLAPSFGRPSNAEVLGASLAALRTADRLRRTVGSSLARAVLERLEAIGGTTNAMDLPAASEAIERTLIDLRLRRIIDIPNAATVPSQQFEPLVTLVAYRLNPKALDNAVAQAAEQRLLEVDRLDPLKGTAMSRAVLEQLSAWGMLTPAVDTPLVERRIPQTLAELATASVVYFGEESDITAESWPSIARYIALSLAPKPDYAAMALERANLRLLTPPLDTGPEPVGVDFF